MKPQSGRNKKPYQDSNYWPLNGKPFLTSSAGDFTAWLIRSLAQLSRPWTSNQSPFIIITIFFLSSFSLVCSSASSPHFLLMVRIVEASTWRNHLTNPITILRLILFCLLNLSIIKTPHTPRGFDSKSPSPIVPSLFQLFGCSKYRVILVVMLQTNEKKNFWNQAKEEKKWFKLTFFFFVYSSIPNVFLTRNC